MCSMSHTASKKEENMCYKCNKFRINDSLAAFVLLTCLLISYFFSLSHPALLLKDMKWAGNGMSENMK